MKVAFDLNPVLINRFSGFYSYGTGLLEGFAALDNRPDFLLFHSSRFTRQAKAIQSGFDNWMQLKTTSIKMRWLEDLWRYSRLPKLEFFTGDFDVYHSFHHLMPPTKNKPRILTVHDLRRYRLPELYEHSKLGHFELALRRADRIIAVSQSTKNDLCSVFSIQEDIIDVIHLATDSSIEPLSDIQRLQTKKRLSTELGVDINDYLIAFSSSDRRKNIARIIQAFTIAQKDLDNDTKLIIAGQPQKRDKITNINNKSVIFTGPVDDIRGLLACSKALIFASLYEGFGIPILDAFASGVPVITSNCSSMPEVGADAAEYVDPYDIESIAQAILKVCSNSETREKMIAAGRQRNGDFSWAKTAVKTIESYKKTL